MTWPVALAVGILGSVLAALVVVAILTIIEMTEFTIDLYVHVQRQKKPHKTPRETTRQFVVTFLILELVQATIVVTEFYR